MCCVTAPVGNPRLYETEPKGEAGTSYEDSDLLSEDSEYQQFLLKVCTANWILFAWRLKPKPRRSLMRVFNLLWMQRTLLSCASVWEA